MFSVTLINGTGGRTVSANPIMCGRPQLLGSSAGGQCNGYEGPVTCVASCTGVGMPTQQDCGFQANFVAQPGPVLFIWKSQKILMGIVGTFLSQWFYGRLIECLQTGGTSWL